MCRWLAYSGTPLVLEEVLYRPKHSLIDQSLHAKMGVETTNGDGFGIGWYQEHARTPAVFHDVGPAWSNRNLREIAGHVRAPLFFAHVRASTGTPVQQTNCHPFRHDRWIWMHNGAIAGFPVLRRPLLLAVDPAFFPSIEGSTDSEVMFYLALTFGLADDPAGGVARMAGFVEKLAREHGVASPLQMTIAVADGRDVLAFRYASAGTPRSLYYSSRVEDLRALHPDTDFLRGVSDETRLVVSEPLGDLPGAWNEVPANSYGVVREGHDRLREFRPEMP
ncbi:class II glutamine amidotransferase [Streptomyces sp. NPDC003388]|uniref:class II glutamine amidotransferase n=1 Tax=unclassified Streptomyces TaxID=2593676 RepID=UPI001171CF26|nr:MULTISPECIES: class II glutamine amidotransferase [unclassified Streptomyces]MDI1452647.1 class II glutamine amidotransferase [Streptomyces sp. ATE26]GEK04023.1 class II glutamine amidotransferase [Streptomyces sp. 1-11]